MKRKIITGFILLILITSTTAIGIKTTTQKTEEENNLPDLTVSLTYLGSKNTPNFFISWSDPTACIKNIGTGTLTEDQKIEIRIDRKSLINIFEKAKKGEYNRDYSGHLPLEPNDEFLVGYLDDVIWIGPGPNEEATALHEAMVMSTRFIFIVDPDNLIEESNEDNNRLYWNFIDIPPIAKQKHTLFQSSLFKLFYKLPLLRILPKI